jgi:hypothetical protein
MTPLPVELPYYQATHRAAVQALIRGRDATPDIRHTQHLLVLFLLAFSIQDVYASLSRFTLIA